MPWSDDHDLALSAAGLAVGNGFEDLIVRELVFFIDDGPSIRPDHDVRCCGQIFAVGSSPVRAESWATGEERVEHSANDQGAKVQASNDGEQALVGHGDLDKVASGFEQVPAVGIEL